MVVSLAFLVMTTILAEEAIISATSAVAFTLISVILFLVAVFFAVKVDYETGVYECRNCGHIHEGKDAPEVCPACDFAKSFFEVHAENY